MRFKHQILLLALVGLISAATAAAQAPNPEVKFYIKIKGMAGEKFPGYGVSSQGVAPRDAATGMASGKRQHKPITIIKEWDAASPRLMQAMQTGDVLESVVIEFVRRGADGKEEVYQTTRLFNVRVATIRPSSGDEAGTIRRPGRPKFENITFTFDTVESRDKFGKTVAMDSWTGQK